MTRTASHAIVLLAHGSRDPLWHKPLHAVAAHIAAASPDTMVACAYLELSSPDLPGSVQTLVDAGIQAIAIVPMFLGVGKHAREDIPVLVDALRQRHPQTQFHLRPAVGEDHRLVRLLAEIALETANP